MNLAYITTLPCDLCDDRRTVRAEPPWDRCESHPFGDFEPEYCGKLRAAQDLSDMAVDAAEHWRVKMRHTPAEVREQQVAGFADMFHDWARDIDCEFADEEWVRDCAPVRKRAAA